MAELVQNRELSSERSEELPPCGDRNWAWVFRRVRVVQIYRSVFAYEFRGYLVIIDLN